MRPWASNHTVTSDGPLAFRVGPDTAGRYGPWCARRNAVHGLVSRRPWFEVYVGLEEEASEIRSHEAEAIRGLLQTEGYARARTAPPAVMICQRPRSKARAWKSRLLVPPPGRGDVVTHGGLCSWKQNSLR